MFETEYEIKEMCRKSLAKRAEDKKWGKNVGEESRKTWEKKFEQNRTSFFDKYMSGKGLDIGGTGYLKDVLPILPTATIVDLDYPGYNGHILPFADNSQDYVYSSHTLEHIKSFQEPIREWFRVVKPGGYIIVTVPHRDLYEKKDVLPSIWNPDHKRFYTPQSLLLEFEITLKKNSYRVRHLQENDEGHDYNQSPDEHSKWLYEIECCIQKL